VVAGGVAAGLGSFLQWLGEQAAKRWVSVLLACYSFTIDWLSGWHGMNFGLRGLLDEPAHEATALVILGTMVRWRGSVPGPRFMLTYLACAVLIDVDHLPAEFGIGTITNGTPRPYTHALWLVLLLALASAAARFLAIRAGRPRRSTAELLLAGAACGVAAHFVRDIATAPMSFWWPLTDLAVQVPYRCYVIAFAVFIALPVTRPRRNEENRRIDHRRTARGKAPTPR
jgi:hypothetical protein